MCPTGKEAQLASGFFCVGGDELCLDLQQLQRLRTPIQETVAGLPAACLGLGDDAKDNLKMRKKLGKPGAPFGGMGFFDPETACEGVEPLGQLRGLSATVVKQAKLAEFWKCTRGLPSIYFWVLQPIFNTHDRCVAAEILVRARNGSDSAPFEDLQAIMDPRASSDIKQVYGEWKAAEIVDFPLKALRENAALRRLSFISSNLRPLDLDPKSRVFRAVAHKLQRLSPEDRELVLSMVLIEITEDQEHPGQMASHIEAWEELGFRIGFDDIVGDAAAGALGRPEQNFNTLEAIEDVAQSSWLVKVDMEWAGHLIFLAHPSMDTRPDMRKEVLQKAQESDELHMPKGPALKKLGVSHSQILAEFAAWARDMIAQDKQIVIELTVRPEDENCACALRKLQEYGLDIYGRHRASFWFQGGPCGAKAFLPSQLATGAKLLYEE